jgi:hypothetical protein
VIRRLKAKRKLHKGACNRFALARLPAEASHEQNNRIVAEGGTISDNEEAYY